MAQLGRDATEATARLAADEQTDKGGDELSPAAAQALRQICCALPKTGLDLAQLLDELIAAGVAPRHCEALRPTFAYPAGGVLLTFETEAACTGAAQAVQSVLAAHRPQVRAQPKTKRELLDALRNAGGAGTVAFKTALIEALEALF